MLNPPGSAGQVRFLFGVHNHQPVGNFDFMFEEAYQKAYLPFLQLITRHPKVRFSLHNSGCLWEWIEGHHPEYFLLVQGLVDRGQVELLSGPFFEAILAVIPERDRQGQIRMLSEYLGKKFGGKPKGAWLPERVWEPELAGTLADAGIKYTLTDDWHFRASGLREEDLDGYYLTEDRGKALAVFPISERMRYLVPFRTVEESLELLSRNASKTITRAVVLADDGEKFGIWPGTHKHCYEDGWLEKFFTALENDERVILEPLGEYLDEAPPKGRAYLPTASYPELTEWALPATAQSGYQELREQVQRSPNPERFLPFVKGGYFRNFFTKYPEANQIHKRMLRVSQKVQDASASEKDPLWQEARRNLYRGQCNCAYWHGIFGGLYLPHLRAALYSCLIAAESSLEQLGIKEREIAVEEVDFDACGEKEVLIETSGQALYFSPSRGGSLLEWDFKAKSRNLCDTLARREEGYHKKILEAATGKASQAGTRSIHERVAAREEGLERFLIYDRRRRSSLLDRFILSGSLDEERCSLLNEGGEFADGAYRVRVEEKPSGVTILLWRESFLHFANGEHRVRVDKIIKVPKEEVKFEAFYEVTNLEAKPLTIRFGIELNFGLLAGNAPDRYYDFPGVALDDRRLASEGEVVPCEGLKLVDEWAGYRIALSWNEPATVWRYPIETISQSEAGFERVYQCSALLPHWSLNLRPGGAWSITLRTEIEEL